MARFFDHVLKESKQMRARRFVHFQERVGALARPIRILDLGGTRTYWERRGWARSGDAHITCLNPVAEKKVHENIEPVEGDATDLSRYDDDAFDIAFSTSVVEHLFTYESQRKMAEEMIRIGRAYWCQTTNYWLPMDPHFHFIGWQWLPLDLRVAILRRRNCGFRSRTPDPEKARERVREVRLLDHRELPQLFPGDELLAERFAGPVKSWAIFGVLPILSR
jgi:hypothetical protein